MKTVYNPNGETVCCIQCGRDTKSKYGICYRCVGCGAGATQINDLKGRKQLSSKIRNGSPDMTSTDEDDE